jgi:uncharacterized membrane protein
VAFCGKCGMQVADGTAFCPRCGAPVGAAAPPPPQYPPQYPQQYPPQQGYQQYPQQPPYPVQPATSGLQENVAGLLCYLLGWLTGIIFLLIDKRPFVRFHAAQSIVVFGVLFVLRLILTFAWVGSYYGGVFGIHLLLSGLLGLITVVAWIVLMVMAYQGKRFEVPVAANIAKSLAGSV